MHVCTNICYCFFFPVFLPDSVRANKETAALFSLMSVADTEGGACPDPAGSEVVRHVGQCSSSRLHWIRVVRECVCVCVCVY